MPENLYRNLQLLTLLDVQGWRKDPVNNDPIVASPAVSRKSAAKSSAQRGKNGIMRGMKKNAKRALIFAAAILGGMAAPLRSAALPNTFEGGYGSAAKPRSGLLRAA